MSYIELKIWISINPTLTVGELATLVKRKKKKIEKIKETLKELR